MEERTEQDRVGQEKIKEKNVRDNSYKNKTSLGQETTQEQEASDESTNPFTVFCPPGISRADITFINNHIDFI